ncbi:leukocyte surface antigen CD53 [Hyalella azteca]|uniref:Leukocyte surface antigen CD53 n=1 Tax=Hyalella azteca TaxID=294128 RepID=A0A8B7PHR3_HYAAZ|nr:leukocyte surface antigen CD53 [Hyalella azteca]
MTNKSEYALNFCNAILMAIGIGFIGVASFTLLKYKPLGAVISPVINEAYCVLGFGCILVVLGIVGVTVLGCNISSGDKHYRRGCCWNFTLIATVVLMVTLAVTELTVGLLLFTPEAVNSQVCDVMNKTFNEYNTENSNSTQYFDTVEQELKCCGVNGYMDWQALRNSSDVTQGCCTNTTAPGCYKDITSLDITQIKNKIYTRGCYEAYKESLHGVSMVTTVFFYAAAAMLVLTSITCVTNLVVNCCIEVEDEPDFGFYKREETTPMTGVNSASSTNSRYRS